MQPEPNANTKQGGGKEFFRGPMASGVLGSFVGLSEPCEGESRLNEEGSEGSLLMASGDMFEGGDRAGERSPGMHPGAANALPWAPSSWLSRIQCLAVKFDLITSLPPRVALGHPSNRDSRIPSVGAVVPNTRERPGAGWEPLVGVFLNDRESVGWSSLCPLARTRHGLGDSSPRHLEGGGCVPLLKGKHAERAPPCGGIHPAFHHMARCP